MRNNAFAPPGALNTAVLFVIFNRPNTAVQVFEAIRKAKPPRLYVASDGPRKVIDEARIVNSLRETVLNDIDWKCNVKILFQDENLGAKYAIIEALKWFFEHEEMGIILEDDCVPSQSFFWFCEELLGRYKNDERIGMISGCNNLGHYENDGYSYLYSTGGSTWGWATWKRSMSNFDPENSILKSKNIQKYLFDATTDRQETEQLCDALKKILVEDFDAWDYQWSVLQKINSMLAVVPTVNLIKNIGFGSDATHTHRKDIQKIYSNVPIYEISFPLNHPPCIIANREFSYKQAAIEISRNPVLRIWFMKIPYLRDLYRMVKKQIFYKNKKQ
jgi:hypothetical protein